MRLKVHINVTTSQLGQMENAILEKDGYLPNQAGHIVSKFLRMALKQLDAQQADISRRDEAQQRLYDEYLERKHGKATRIQSND